MVFRKNLRSLERRWEKISKFLGDLPSEQIFYRNIPLGAPVLSELRLSSKTKRRNRLEYKANTLSTAVIKNTCTKYKRKKQIIFDEFH